MEEPRAEETRPEEPGQTAPYRCKYCGGSLDLRYHFCVHCAVTYRAPDENVYGKGPPFVRSLEWRISTEGRAAVNLFCILAMGLICLAGLRYAMGKEQLGLSLILTDLFVAALTIGFAASNWRSIAHLFGGVRVNSALALSLPILAILLCVNKGYHDFLSSILGIKKEDTEIGEILGSLDPAILFVTICVFPAIFEEIGFRGLVQEKMVLAAGPVLGFAATSVLFVALHSSILSAPYLFLLAWFLSWVRARTGSLYPPMLLHFVHNFVVVVVFYGVRP